MTKETFLTLIQGEARWPGKAQEAWNQALALDDQDPRWKLIYDESESPVEAIRQFDKYFFGIEAQPKQRPKKRTQVERWTAEVEKAKARMLQYPDHVEAHQRRLAEMETKLAHAIKNNL